MTDKRFTDSQVVEMLRLMYVKAQNDTIELGSFAYQSDYDYECHRYTHELFNKAEKGEL